MKVSRNNTAAVSALLLTIVISMLSGCGSGPGSDGLEKKGGISLNLDWPSGYSFDASTSQLSSTSSPKMSAAPAYVTGCSVTVSGADMSPVTLDVPLSTGQVSGSVPPGERHFSVVVNTNIGLTFTGSTSATLVPGYNGVISIGLSVNSPPELNGISVSNSSPRKRESVTLTATVADQDTADAQSFTWGGGGGSISGSGSSVGWSADKSGSYTVTVAASDGHGGVARGSAVINVRNITPVINYVAADMTTASVGDVVNIDCSASDADGDRLSYTWSDGNGWVASGAASHYKVNLAGVTTLTCEVDDGDANGRASGSVRISASGSSSLAPTGVAALGGNTQVTITWNPVAGATSYNLYWSVSPGVTTTSSKIAGVNSPHMHTGLSNGSIYYYAVTAVDPTGESPLSAEVSATPQAVLVIPPAPTGVTAVAGINQITVSWNFAPGATSYKIYWLNTAGVVPGLAAPNWMTSLSNQFVHTTIDGLVVGNSYYYIVTALNAAGESPASVEVLSTAQAPGITTVEGYVKYGNSIFISGVTVQLYGGASWSGGVAATFVSDANGFFSFTGVAYPLSFDSTFIDLLSGTIPGTYNGVTWGCNLSSPIAMCDFYLAMPAGVIVGGDNTSANLTITVTPPPPAYSCDATISQGGPALASSGAPSLFTGAWVWSPTNPIAGLSPGLTYDLNYHCYDTFGNTVSYSVTPTSFIY